MATRITAVRERDWWSLHGLDRGHEVRCGSAKVFLAYLLSPGTSPKSRLVYRNPEEGTASFHLCGPMADDFEFLTLRYTLSAKEVHEHLSAEDKRLLLARLAELWGPAYSPGHALTLVRGALNL